MLPFAEAPRTTKVVAGGKSWTLNPMFGEAGIAWVKATVEDGRLMAEALRDVEVSESTIRQIFLRGYERTAQALGCTVEEAAEFTESERYLVVQAQDKLNQTEIIAPYLALDQAAARASFGMKNGKQ